MSIYEGTDTQQSYAHGRDVGRREGDADMEQGLGRAPDVIESMRAAAESHGVYRAFALGYLRGYREAVRTQDAKGRWGT